MSSVIISGDTSGAITVAAPAVSGTTTLTLPATTGTVLADTTVGVCRAWVNFNGTGTPAIRAFFNVTNITDNGTGSYAINFTNAFADTNYACVMATKGSAGAGTPFLPVEHASLAARTTTSVAFYVLALSGATPDADVVEIAVFR
jgi:hypothetical protein